MLIDHLPCRKNTCMEVKRECFEFSFALWPWPFNLLLLVILSSSGLSASQFETPTTELAIDHLALTSFKSLISSDPSEALASWNSSSFHFCQWRGVTCRNRGGEPRVTAIRLESLHLAGTLSPFLANLTFLHTLDLSENDLQGPIPEELGLLSHLKYLNLSNNPLGGTIPISLFGQNCSKLQIFSLRTNSLQGTIPRNLSNCLELQIIGLNDNMLEGDIPNDLGYLPKLQLLGLYNNRLTGSIPPEIGNLSSLTGLYLFSNGLIGTIPAAICNLSSLVDLVLWNNHLTGAIPSNVGNLIGLSRLYLHFNHLTGAIPSGIGNLVHLNIVSLGGNQLSGTIPESLGSLENLETLFLDANKLEAWNAAEWRFLDALSNCTHLRVMSITSNLLGGMLPKSIANLSTTLEWLNLTDNQIAGSLPVELGNLINLTVIIMSSNLLDGTIPAALGSLSKLGIISIAENYLVGEIPITLGNLTTLIHLDLSSNELQGSIPPGLGKCQLDTLNLGSNKLTGTVPKEILSIVTLSMMFNISRNSLIGSLPSEIGYLVNIASIDVSNNRLSGEIPSTIGQCEVLQNLYMQGNRFQGSIPSTFSQLQGLQVLDISSNNLSGHIPDFLGGSHSMSYLNLSYNDLDGEVPEDGVFRNASAFSVVGNNNVCGGVPELGLPSCSSRRKNPSEKLIVISVTGGISCVIFLISLFSARYWPRKSRRLSSVTSRIKDQHRKVSFAELLKATDGFLPANLIGRGSFGSVYKGTMDWEGHKDVAVKVLDLQQKGASRSFIADCEALRNIRHRNLVKILTSCSSVDFQGNDFKALVFEFLPNGSLDQWLHAKVDEQGSLRMLSLIQRLNICIDVASALGYLHQHTPTPIVHCDLKPSNVLLDHDMVAHVGDFGLARFLNEIASKSVQRSTSSVTFKGSIGYAAPEYGMANKASAEGDAYSYGILILEMFTGKRPTDDSFKEVLNLHQYVEMTVPEQVVQIIDPSLLSEGHTNLLTNGVSMTALECITSVLRVGILCSKESPKERMQIKDVIRELHNIRHAFLGLPHGSSNAIAEQGN